MSGGSIERGLAALRARESEISVDAEPDRWSGRVTALMESFATSPRRLERLVGEFAGTQNPEFANSLAFLLAGAANHEAGAPAIAPLVVRAMCALSVSSPWPRLNLCTAVQRLLMFQAVPPSLGRPLPGLARLLLDSLDSGNHLVQAVAAVVYNDVHYAGLEDALTAADRAAIEPRILVHAAGPHGELAREARTLRERLG